MALTPLASVDRSAFRWLRTGESPAEFTLLAGEAEVAKLRWGPDERSLASASTAAATWTLQRGGFLNPHITVRTAGNEETLARLTSHLSSHRIEIAGGATYRFHRAGMLVPAWKVSTEDGREVLHIEPVREGRSLAGGAAIPAASSTGAADLLLLTVLGWYFIVLVWFEDEALVPLEGPDATGGGAAPPGPS